MAELQQQERLQPALLDRLTDDSPSKSRRHSYSSHISSGGNSNSQQDSSDREVEPAANPSAEEPVLSQQPNPSKIPLHQSNSLVISSRKLRECVKRDLSSLFNTANLEAVMDLDDYPLVTRSVLNFGIPDLTGSTVKNINTSVLARKLKEVILQYEPRIIGKSLSIHILSSDEMSSQAIRFEIECDIWGQPAPEHVRLNSEIDLSTGSFQYTDFTSN